MQLLCVMLRLNFSRILKADPGVQGHNCLQSHTAHLHGIRYTAAQFTRFTKRNH